MILITDILFYLIFIPAITLLFSYLIYALNKFSYLDMLSGFQDLDMQTLSAAKEALTNLLIAFISALFVFFIFIILNISILKNIIRFKTLGKKIRIKSLLKSIILNIILFIIFTIPFIISLRSLIITNQYGMPMPIGNIPPIRFIPIIMVIFIAFYFTGIANLQIVKTGKIGKSLLNMFKLGALRAKQLFLPYFFTFLTIMGALRFLSNLRIFGTFLGWMIFLPLVIAISFMYRVHLAKNC